MKIPARVSWAVDLLKIDRGLRVLEIGCGRGFAARALTDSLGVNGYVGIDRSKVAIQAARKLNADAEQRGIASFRLGEFGEGDVGSRLFDAVLAINVNAFWTDGEDAAAHVLPVMKTRGRMLLVYELPSPADVEEKIDLLSERLRTAGFRMVAATRAPAPHTALFAMWARKS